MKYSVGKMELGPFSPTSVFPSVWFH